MTKRPVRSPTTGMYTVNGKNYKELFGSRTQVHNGTAYKTAGGLTKSNLMMNKWGRIVSAVKHTTAKKEKRLEKAGYFAKKGKFGFVKKSIKNVRISAKKGSKSRKMRGGNIFDDVTGAVTGAATNAANDANAAMGNGSGSGNPPPNDVVE